MGLNKLLLTLIVGMFMISFVSSSLWDTSLTTYYKLDESSGAVIDSNGIQNGTNYGATAGVTGKINTSYNFTGGSATSINLTNNSALSLTNNFTISAWIYTNNVPASGNGGGIVTKATDAGGGAESSYNLFIDNGNLVFHWKNATTKVTTSSSPSDLNSNSWYHVLIKKELNNITMWLNGTKVDEDTYYGTTYSSITPSRIGAYATGTGVNMYSFNGTIDEVGLWDRALIDTEIAAIYNSGFGLEYGSDFPFKLGLCNSTMTVNVLNISFKDESLLSTLNASIPLGTLNWYQTSNQSNNGTIIITNTTENPYYAICSDGQTNFIVDPYVQYASTGYPQRIWNPSVASYNSTTTNQILYLLSSSNGIYTTFQIINSVEQSISGVFATATREISGSNVQVASGTTGEDGTVTFWLNPDFSHDFNFSKTGLDTYTASFPPTQSAYTIQMGGTTTPVISYFRGINFNLYPVNKTLYNGTTYTFQFNLSSSYWDVDEYGFNLRLNNGTIITGNSTSVEGTILSKSYNVGNSTSIYMDYYWTVNGTTTSRSQKWVVFNPSNTQWSILNFVNRLKTYMDVGFFGLDDFGRYLITFVIIFITVGVMSYKYGLTSPFAVTFMIFAVVLFLDVTLGLIPSITLPNGKESEHILTFLTGLIFAIIAIKEASQAQ